MWEPIERAYIGGIREGVLRHLLAYTTKVSTPWLPPISSGICGKARRIDWLWAVRQSPRY